MGVPHFYESIAGWFDFADLYREAVDEAQDGARFVEVGSWLGRSAAFLAVEIARSGKRIALACVDTFRGTPSDFDHEPVVQQHGGSVREAFERAMRAGGVADRIEIIEARSEAAAASFADESLDFVFIDADHSYEAIRGDIAAWAPKVKVGGVLAGHDHTSQFPGVMRAVTEAFSRHEAERAIRGRSWWYRKPALGFCVAITTAPRSVSYLPATLSDVLRGTSIVGLSGPVRVCVSGDAAVAERLAGEHAASGRCGFEPARPAVWSLVGDSTPHRRCCANTWQALVGAPPDSDVLMLQDDIELSQAWPLHLRYRLRLARARHGERFMVALYSAYRFEGEHLAEYPAAGFYGNQAVYFPAAVAREYAAFLWENGVSDPRLPDDMALKEYATSAEVPILVALPNLAQHVGRETTGLGHFHDSPTFARTL